MTPAEKEIDAVAKAICLDFNQGCGWDTWRDTAEEDREAWRKTARAALKALAKMRRKK